MEQINKENDNSSQQFEYSFLTPVNITFADYDAQENMNFSYNNHLHQLSSPKSDEENYSSESNTGQQDQFSKRSDPFSPECKIPIPGIYGDEHYFDATTFIRRRNERERARVRNVNDGFERLRQHLPLTQNQKDKRLSKVETLRFAIAYINHLRSLLDHSKSD